MAVICNCKTIKAIVSDVDGVLTDGGFYYNEDGLVVKKFNTRDASCIFRLREAGIKLFIITMSDDLITNKRIETLKNWHLKDNDIEWYFHGIDDKLKVVNQICEEWGYKLDELIYIGDDYVDIPVMEVVGISYCPYDSPISVIEAATYICEAKGGEGVLSEVVDNILRLGDTHTGLKYPKIIEFKKGLK